MKVRPTFAVLAFLFRPKHFNKLAVEHVAYLNAEDAKAPKGVSDQSEILSKRTSYVRTALGKSLLLVLGAVAIGWLTGYCGNSLCGPTTFFSNRLLQFGGIGILLWATLAKQGWNIQTIAGRSLTEIVDQWLYRTLYVIGSYLLVLSVSWPTE